MDRRLPPAAVLENTRAVVKWFNARKGYGFVTPDAGDRDALLHISVLSRAGRESIDENAVIMCDIAEDRRGWQVSAIHSVEEPAPGQGGGGQDGPAVDGYVKFFSPLKGFGFITPDEGDRDIFVSAMTLERCGIAGLEPNQRVRLSTRSGPKGLQAVRVELIDQ